MKLDLFDSYNIRVRLSSSIIIFAPLALTVFLCFDELFTFISSSVLVAILLAFTNCLPIFQRHICQKRVTFKNYAVEFLLPHDNTLNLVTKSVTITSSLKQMWHLQLFNPLMIVKVFVNAAKVRFGI